MLKLKVIAAHITNLTDARYFAARGVDYLHFDMDEISIESVNDIKEWVEGPGILLVFSDKSVHLLEEALLKIEPAALSLKSGTLYNIDHLLPFYSVFHYESQDGEEEILFDDLRFVSPSDDISSILSSFLPDETLGLLISGSSETKTGIKTYTDLDTLFDALEL